MTHVISLHLDFLLPLSIEAASKEEAESIIVRKLKAGNLKIILDTDDCYEEITSIKPYCVSNLPTVQIKPEPKTIYDNTDGLVYIDEFNNKTIFFRIYRNFNWHYIRALRIDDNGDLHRLTDIWFDDTSPGIIRKFSLLSKEQFFELELEKGGITEEQLFNLSNE